MESTTSAVQGKLARAHKLTRVKTPLPAFFNPLFRKQGPINSLLIDSLQQLSAAMDESLEHFNRVLDPQVCHLLQALAPMQTAFDQRCAEHEAELAELNLRVVTLESRLKATEDRFAAELRKNEESTAQRLSAHEERLNQQATEQSALLATSKAQHENHLEGLERISRLELASISHDSQLRTQQALDWSLRRVESIRSDIFSALHNATEKTNHQISEVVEKNAQEESDTAFDRFYLAFENRFRGTREQIKIKQAFYIPVVEKTIGKLGLAEADARLLDIGCGRGEWLELARERGWTAVGIDFNARMVETCRALGLSATQEDAIAYLRRQPSGSLHFITTFHVIEHLRLQQRFELYREVLRVLAVGGTAVFETPNPENIIVGACNFYFDPTHVRPLVPPSEEVVLREIGFGEVRIERLHPFDPQHRATSPSGEVTEQFNRFFYGPQDFSLICVK